MAAGVKCMVVSSAWLSRLGNWSATFVMPYQRFLDAMKRFGGSMDRRRHGDKDDRFELFEDLVAPMKEDQRSALNNLINSLGDSPVDDFDFDALADTVRKIIFRHTKSNLFEHCQEQMFKDFIRDWCVWTWDKKAHEASEVAEATMGRAVKVRKMIKKFNERTK